MTIVEHAIDFHGDNLIMFHQDGMAYTPIKPMCACLGLDWELQRQRIDRDDVLRESARLFVYGTKHIYCLPIDYLNGWLFGIDGAQIPPDRRVRLTLYKRECYRVLAGTLQGRQEGAAHLSPEAAAIIAILQAHQGDEPMDCQTIIRMLQQDGYGVDARPTWLRLRRMAARGLIVRCGRGAYRVR